MFIDRYFLCSHVNNYIIPVLGTCRAFLYYLDGSFQGLEVQKSTPLTGHMNLELKKKPSSGYYCDKNS